MTVVLPGPRILQTQPHLREHVARVRGHDVAAEAQHEAGGQRPADRRMAHPHLQLRLGAHRDLRLRALQVLPVSIRARVAVDVDHVGAEQAVEGELVQAAGHAPDAARVGRDDHPHLAGGRHLAPGVLEGDQARLGERDAHRDAVSRETLHETLDAPGIIDAHRVRGEVRVGPRRREIAVREGRADPGVHQPLDRLVGVLRGVVAMGEVQDGRDARVQRLERADEVADVDVLRGVAGGERRADPEEVVQQRPVRADPAQRGLPGVPMRVDEAGHDHPALRVDDLGIGPVEVPADRPDPVVLDEHRAALDLPDRRVHREHVAVGQHGSPHAPSWHSGAPSSQQVSNT